ncbi:MAG: hypothetical protein J7L25_08775 [Deltaproteobacteria bacterium]|nr:hypothetical protein [Candidatus Tharpella aukensis]
MEKVFHPLFSPLWRGTAKGKTRRIKLRLKGKLDFDPWEQIFYGEFDGNRKKCRRKPLPVEGDQ